VETLVSVLAGVAIGYIPNLITEYRALGRNAKYLAIRVICILDDYVERCLLVVIDDGTIDGQPDKDGYYYPQQPEPDAPIFPSDLDWKCIDHKLSYRILNLPNEASIARRMIQGASDMAYPPDFEDTFKERQRQYARLGLDAIEITESLRKTYGLPERSNKKVKEFLIDVEQKLAENSDEDTE
jgi:hypothetical protein